MAEFIKGRALSEDSAPLACWLRRFILTFSQAFSAGAVRMDGACFCSRTAQSRAAVPDRNTPEAPHTALRVFKDTVILIS